MWDNIIRLEMCTSWITLTFHMCCSHHITGIDIRRASKGVANAIVALFHIAATACSKMTSGHGGYVVPSKNMTERHREIWLGPRGVLHTC
jgi:hypothetical protein